MSDLSATASSNSPAGADTIGSTADDYIRAAYGILRTTNAKASDVASATTTDIGAATAEFVDVTGTTTITGLGTISAGIVRVVRFTGALTLTYNATSLILPGAANIQTTAGDVGIFRSLGSGNWVCTAWLPSSIQPNILEGFVDGVFGVPVNLSLAASASANALTVSIKTKSGADPSVSSPVVIPYRSPTEATGTFAIRQLTAAQSITIPSGATLGAVNSTPFRVWILWLDDGTDYSIGIINCVDSNVNIAALSSFGIGGTATSIGTGSDSARVVYTDGSPTTSFSWRVLGYIEYSSGLATVGTWASGPTRIQIYSPDVPLPGSVLRILTTRTGGQDTGTTTFVGGDNIPQQSTEGDLFQSQAITPASSANVLRITHNGYYTHTTTTTLIICALFQDSTENALSVAASAKADVAGAAAMVHVNHVMLAGTSSSTTFKIHAGGVTAGTTAFNGSSSARAWGGVLGSHLTVEEIQG
jgi:hypothetical protein